MAAGVTTIRSRLARLEERHLASIDKIEALDRLILARLEASNEAIDKAESANDKRFAAVNEFRAQLADQAAHFLTRETFEAQLGAINNAGQLSNDALRTRLSALEKTLERQQGRGAGLAAGWGYLVTAFGLILTIATLVIIFSR